ncbi:MAG: AraC family transcriptional regulator [Chloroflexi bacterium]|nr:MAG: AraC family transcriptional regulator [Chloroflexota bacterium]
MTCRCSVPREIDYHIELITAEPSPTVVVVATTTWERFPTLWKELLDQVWAFVRENDLSVGHNIMLYKDDVPNVEVGVLVTSAFTPTGRVVASSLPAGRVARTLHRGPYDRLDEPHRAVRDWCTARGLALAGPRWEIYGDWREDPAALETQVSYLLA